METITYAADRLYANKKATRITRYVDGVATGTTPLDVVANQQKRLPPEFVAASGNGMTDAFVAYATPLIGDPLPELFRL